MIAILVAASIDALGHKQIFIALLQFACYIQRESVRSCNAASSRRMNRRLDYSLIHRAVTSDESSVGSHQSIVFALKPIIHDCLCATCLCRRNRQGSARVFLLSFSR